jgi:hypothetical protein
VLRRVTYQDPLIRDTRPTEGRQRARASAHPGIQRRSCNPGTRPTEGRQGARASTHPGIQRRSCNPGTRPTEGRQRARASTQPGIQRRGCNPGPRPTEGRQRARASARPGIQRRSCNPGTRPTKGRQRAYPDKGTAQGIALQQALTGLLLGFIVHSSQSGLPAPPRRAGDERAAHHTAGQGR